jgi:hypothetical protein
LELVEIITTSKTTIQKVFEKNKKKLSKYPNLNMELSLLTSESIF